MSMAGSCKRNDRNTTFLVIKKVWTDEIIHISELCYKRTSSELYAYCMTLETQDISIDKQLIMQREPSLWINITINGVSCYHTKGLT